MIIVATAVIRRKGDQELLEKALPFNIEKLSNYRDKSHVELIVREEIQKYLDKYNRGKKERFHRDCISFKILHMENDKYFHSWVKIAAHEHRCSKCGLVTNPNHNAVGPCQKPPKKSESKPGLNVLEPNSKQKEIMEFIGRMGCIHRISEGTYEALADLNADSPSKKMRKSTFEELKPFLYETYTSTYWSVKEEYLSK
jgi:hypothetical protein